jgi:hypothetical protein
LYPCPRRAGAAFRLSPAASYLTGSMIAVGVIHALQKATVYLDVTCWTGIVGVILRLFA